MHHFCPVENCLLGIFLSLEASRILFVSKVLVVVGKNVKYSYPGSCSSAGLAQGLVSIPPSVQTAGGASALCVQSETC